MLCKLNRDCLRDIFPDALSVLELEARPVSGARMMLGAFHGYIDGVSAAVVAKAAEEIERKAISCVFIDGSNLGEIAAYLKQRVPSVKVATFFHNVESRFFLGSFKASRTLRSLGVFLANYLAERKAIRHSDITIALSRRDSELLRRVYGRAASVIAPMALEDKLPPTSEAATKASAPLTEKYILFVGGAFYANRLGIAWFVKNVVPRIGIKTVVVGKGLEELRAHMEMSGNVEVIGAVPNLAEWYSNAHFVIAPIFDGSGMKTKVAEAMMFGKKIIGTPEAFSGYEEFVDVAGRMCVSSDDFVTAIETADAMVKQPFDAELRNIYEENYSYRAAKLRLQKILTCRISPGVELKSNGTIHD
jgi:glycosyltransferase involved in cell wall biosynthesis